MTSLSDDRDQMKILLDARRLIQDEIDELKVVMDEKRAKVQDELLADIRSGNYASKSGDPERDLALKGLRYRGLIRNVGSRIKPEYVTVSQDKAAVKYDINREYHQEKARESRNRRGKK